MRLKTFEDERELRKVEEWLRNKFINAPFVRCSYDAVVSHKHLDKEEMKYRKEYGLPDYVINYEVYNTEEEYNANNGGSDGEVHECYYTTGNKGMYITITGIQ